VRILQNEVKNVILGTTKPHSVVTGMRLRKLLLNVSTILYNPSHAIMSPIQNLGEQPRQTWEKNTTYQHDTAVVQISVIAYWSGLLVQCDRRHGAGVCVYHMAPSLFLEFKNLWLLS